LREDFLKARICLSEAIPQETVELLVEELAATKWFVTPMGKIQIVPKDRVREDIGRSPDYADNLMLFYATSADWEAERTVSAKVIGQSMLSTQDF